MGKALEPCLDKICGVVCSNHAPLSNHNCTPSTTTTSILVSTCHKDQEYFFDTMAEIHSHDGLTPHFHDHSAFNAAEHGHSHEILDGPGSYMGREMPLIEGRDWNDRAFTVGIGGYALTHLTT